MHLPCCGVQCICHAAGHGTPYNTYNTSALPHLQARKDAEAAQREGAEAAQRAQREAQALSRQLDDQKAAMTNLQAKLESQLKQAQQEKEKEQAAAAERAAGEAKKAQASCSSSTHPGCGGFPLHVSCEGSLFSKPPPSLARA